MIKLYVNGQYLEGYTDSTFTGSRRVGLYAESEGHHPVTLRYDDFIVWSVGGTASADADGTLDHAHARRNVLAIGAHGRCRALIRPYSPI